MAGGELVFPVAALCEMKLVLSSREGWKVWHRPSWEPAAFAPELLGCNVRKGRRRTGQNSRSIMLTVPVILRKSGPFVTSGDFNLPWQKNLVINFYLTV